LKEGQAYEDIERMSKLNLSRIKKLESIGHRVNNFRYMTDEQLLASACGNDPAIVASVTPAFRTGGLDAGFEELYRVLFRDDPENLALILEADRRGDDETVARMLDGRYAGR
jgi:hypothetical protein